MSKEIDFSKAPEGATHYRKSDGGIDWYKVVANIPMYWVESRNIWRENPLWFCDSIIIPLQWSIYTNDKPLSDLSDEKAAALFNHWRSGGELEFCASNHQWRGCTAPEFYKNHIYRALKPKSERELFVEQCTKVMREAGTKCPDNHEYFGVLFDSGKFQLKDSEK